MLAARNRSAGAARFATLELLQESIPCGAQQARRHGLVDESLGGGSAGARPGHAGLVAKLRSVDAHGARAAGGPRTHARCLVGISHACSCAESSRKALCGLGVALGPAPHLLQNPPGRPSEAQLPWHYLLWARRVYFCATVLSLCQILT